MFVFAVLMLSGFIKSAQSLSGISGNAIVNTK